jgi:Ni,Fe-hydrogenase I cytochrome b subunit
MQTKQMFDTLYCVKRLRSRYKIIAANYLGGLGYYSLLVAFALWIAGLVAKIEQYVVGSGSRQLTDAASSADVYSTATAAPASWLAALFSFLLLVLTVCVLLALPYYVGKFMSKAIRRLLFMTGSTAEVQAMHRMKVWVAMVFVGVIILTCYKFTHSATENIYALLLVGLAFTSVIWFILQNTAVKLWKLKKQDVY